MFFLKKVFQLRDKSNPDMEKPFLEHLEDLRATITRVVLTLILATILCFAFQEQVMEILKRPANDVWDEHVQTTLPKEIKASDWERAKVVLDHSLLLEGTERESYLQRFEPEVLPLVEAVRYLRTAAVLPDGAREAYLADLSAAYPDLSALMDQLGESGANPGASAGQEVARMSTLKPGEGFMLSMKLSFFSGIVVSFPLLLYFILQFVLPGLHTHERKILWPALAVGFGLFLVGVAFAYFIVLPKALAFFFQWDQGLNLGTDWRIGWYIGFATQFTLLFGLSFELPVVVMALVKIGILGYESMSRTRPYAVLAIVVISAMITPTADVVTLMLMAVPMYLLYEACIWLAWLDRRAELRREEAEARERLARLLEDEKRKPLDPDHTEEDEQEDTGDPHPENDPGHFHDKEHDPHHEAYHDPDYHLYHDEYGNPISPENDPGVDPDYHRYHDEDGNPILPDDEKPMDSSDEPEDPDAKYKPKD